MKKRKGKKKQPDEQGKTRAGRRKRPRVPPPESSAWPEQYRGKRWKSVFAILFTGRCQLCAYSCPLPKTRQLSDKWLGATRLLLCTNHPAGPGELREVLPTDTCRNFKAKSWLPPRPKAAPDLPPPMPDESDPTIRRIPVGSSLYAIVDACDYKKLSKFKWSAYRTRRRIYAVCHHKGKTVYMHRLIIRPRKGYVVDHIDGNGLNNRRCNLRTCNAPAESSQHGTARRVLAVCRCAPPQGQMAGGDHVPRRVLLPRAFQR